MVAAAATSRLASAAWPRTGGTEVSSSTAKSAAPGEANNRRAHNQLATSSSARNGSVPSLASVSKRQ